MSGDLGTGQNVRMIRKDRAMKTLKYAFTRSVPVMCGYLFLGTAYGLLMQQAGFGWYWSGLASTLVFAGSMQFVLVGMLKTGTDLVTVAMTTLLVNGRHIFYGISLLDRFKEQKKRYPYMVSTLTDETYSLLVSGHPDGVNTREADFWIAVLDHCYWVTGSILGGLLGNIIPFDLTGIDFAMTALFVTILVEQMRTAENRKYGIAGILVAVALLLLLGPDRFLLATMGLIVVVSYFFLCRGGMMHG